MRTAGKIVGNAERAGALPRRYRLEGHRYCALIARAQRGAAGVGLGEAPADLNAGDRQRRIAHIGQREGLGAAAGSYPLS